MEHIYAHIPPHVVGTIVMTLITLIFGTLLLVPALKSPIRGKARIYWSMFWGLLAMGWIVAGSMNILMMLSIDAIGEADVILSSIVIATGLTVAAGWVHLMGASLIKGARAGLGRLRKA